MHCRGVGRGAFSGFRKSPFKYILYHGKNKTEEKYCRAVIDDDVVLLLASSVAGAL